MLFTTGLVLLQFPAQSLHVILAFFQSVAAGHHVPLITEKNHTHDAANRDLMCFQPIARKIQDRMLLNTTKPLSDTLWLIMELFLDGVVQTSVSVTMIDKFILQCC